MEPVASINLEREHQVINYAPVEFAKRNTRLWLPENTSIYVVYRGRRYERVHRFSQFHLFSVDSLDAVKEPPTSKFRTLSSDYSPLSEQVPLARQTALQQ